MNITGATTSTSVTSTSVAVGAPLVTTTGAINIAYSHPPTISISNDFRALGSRFLREGRTGTLVLAQSEMWCLLHLASAHYFPTSLKSLSV